MTTVTPGVCLGPGCGPVANNFLRGVKFSPDGLCVLTNSEDTTLRIFDLFSPLADTDADADADADTGTGSEQAGREAGRSRGQPVWSPVLEMHEGGMVYDFDWYPLMDSRNPAS